MTYPGFKPTELTELPHGLEAPQLLDRVTRAQEFNVSYIQFIFNMSKTVLYPQMERFTSVKLKMLKSSIKTILSDFLE